MYFIAVELYNIKNDCVNYNLSSVVLYHYDVCILLFRNFNHKTDLSSRIIQPIDYIDT